MRIVLALLIVLAGAAVALWQLDVVDLPFDAPSLRRVQGPPPLFELAKSDDVAALRAALAEEGAVVDARDEFGQTPLMYAAGAEGSLAAVRELLAAGADPNARSDSGWTPLMYAARDATDPLVVLTLMNAAADPTVRNAEGMRAVDYARSNAVVASTLLLPRLAEVSDGPFDPNWPSGFVVPVEGATLSSRESHLPGAPRAYRNGTHQGFDFYDGTVSVEIAYGTPIVAVASGTVIRADRDYVELTPEEYDRIIGVASANLTTPEPILDQLRGRQVWIEHPGGFVSRYAHLSSIAEGIEEGVFVAQGSVIATTGNSGTAEAAAGTQDGPHPHVELWRGATFLGAALEPDGIYERAAQVFGEDALPPFRGS